VTQREIAVKSSRGSDLKDLFGMASYRLTVMGGFTLTRVEGGELALPTRKDRLLLAYLALTQGQAQDRARLAGLLWGDRGETQARDSLRQSIAALRQALREGTDDPLQSDRDSIALKPGAIEVDARRFVELAETSPAMAIAAYPGVLLEGMDGLTPEFDAWLVPERERLDALAARALQRVADSTASPSERLAGIALARRMLSADPTREPVMRALMQLLAANGERSEALKVYGAGRECLKRDLGVVPDAETETLYRAILTAGAQSLSQETTGVAQGAERPAIAVLPFRNLSEDASLDGFSDVLGEELITGLGRYREFLVIDRDSAAMVATASADIAEIGRKLAVDLLVQGSLQRQGEHLRITVRLVNASTRIQLWGDAFELPAAHMLSLPEDAVRGIVATLHGRVEHSMVAERRPRRDLTAYACLLRGVKHLRGYGPDDNAKAIALFDEALRLDPAYHLARLYRAFADIVVNGYGNAPDEIFDRAVEAGLAATEAEPGEGRAHFLLGLIYGLRGEAEFEIERYRRAIALNPSDANAIAVSGLPLAAVGRIDEAIERFRLAMRLNPHHPEWYWDDLGSIFYLAERYADSVASFRRCSRLTPYSRPRYVAALAQLGEWEQMRLAVAELLKLRPNFSIGELDYRGWSAEQAEHLRDGMRKAGLPD
jgi:DNA-binding SARP family transcriptional activator/Tfp pilus assembly protein PilF